jgi:hypothetical protein
VIAAIRHRFTDYDKLLLNGHFAPQALCRPRFGAFHLRFSSFKTAILSEVRQDLRKVDGFKFFVLLAQEPLQVHQTAGVVRNQILSTGVQSGRRLGLTHGARDHRELDGERASEPAAAGSKSVLLQPVFEKRLHFG